VLWEDELKEFLNLMNKDTVFKPVEFLKFTLYHVILLSMYPLAIIVVLLFEGSKLMVNMHFLRKDATKP